ncbi:MAG: nucleotidyltransferase family protein, partial [Burkholderiales bacterium]|nr:nucleotidyltransferase family protein [Burkholderiales bacterium]
APEDLLMHSITHLMHEGELHNGLRDLHDIHGMVAAFASTPGFWQRLVRQAAGNDLAPPVAAGLVLAHRTFGTKVPPDVLSELDAAAGWRRSAVAWAYGIALRHPSPRHRPWWACAAHGALYLRGHWLRMRPSQLMRHLAVKSWKSAKAWREE